MVSIDIKVILQGALVGTDITMSNLIQTGGGLFTAPSLPTTNPYGTGESYDQINNTAGTAGTVVDWVKVEVRSAAEPTQILEARALLLRPDGHIVDTNGLEPKFNSQNVPCRIVVFHRNHLSVMSNDLDFSGAVVSCDFRSGLSNAFRVNPEDPEPMVEQSGVWCMWAGDMNMDGVIDNSDYALFITASAANLYDKYMVEDITLDGIVDNSDIALATVNFGKNLYSPLLYYPA